MSFFQEAITSANKFIKTICFIDDQPMFNKIDAPPIEGTDHRIYANEIIKAFAPQGKFCTFYQYQQKEEEKQVLALANESDISVLDWRIILTESPRSVSKEDIAQEENLMATIPSEVDEDEEVVEEKESRGRHALDIIEHILKNDFKSPKVILIFTAEYEVESIFNPIKKRLEDLHISFESDFDNLFFQNEKFRIAIYFKESLEDKYVSEDVKSKILTHEIFPQIVNQEFAYLVNGLVLKTAIDSIAEVRANTFSLLESYNKNLDPAFLTHKSLLPHPFDAEEHLLEIIGSDIKAILKSSGIIDNFRKTALPEYLKEKFQNDEYSLTIPNADKFSTLKVPDVIDKNTLFSFINNGIEKTVFNSEQPFTEKMIFSKSCHKELIRTFAYDISEDLANKSNIQFAILTTIRPNYLVKQFELTQGTIIKEEKKANFWLCIQPKCDSVRITTEKRFFSFLRLFKSDQNSFHIVLDSNNPIYLKIDYKIYNSKAFEFDIDANEMVSSFVDNGYKKFKSCDGKKMIWLAELKNDYAQSISNNFSIELSRVGLNLSEWLRRSS